MSIVMSVIFRGKLPDRKTLSRTMTELGFPFTIAASVGPLERHSGYMPMWLRREVSGVEFDVETDSDRAEIAEMEELAGTTVDPAFDRVANFRWGGDEREMVAGMCSAAALAKLVSGVVFDDQESQLLSADEAITSAREIVQSVLKPEEKPRRGTRPADLKHYLKPLLKQRNDLVLVGRYLLIRPIRHVLRGASLSGTSDKYEFQIWRYLLPLWESPGWVAFSDKIHPGEWEVWQPHFEPLLMDALAHEVFAPLGEITSLQDVADTLPDIPYHGAAVALPLLVLAGERDRAESYVKRIEESDPSYWKQWAKAQRDFLARDIGDICATFHAREAATAKALKLEDIWEPSPFPVEVTPAARKLRSDESLFVPEPWISRPLSLVQEMPEQPGIVRFAKRWIFRGRDRPLLVASLSREDAEDRHRNAENYVLATRLPDGLGVLMDRRGRDRHDPRRDNDHPNPTVYAGGYRVDIYARQFVAHAEFWRNHDVDGVFQLSMVDVRARVAGPDIWRWGANRHSSQKWVYDCRGGRDVRREEPLSDADWNRLRIPAPGFGEFDVFVQMVRDLLRSEGYGEFS